MSRSPASFREETDRDVVWLTYTRRPLPYPSAALPGLLVVTATVCALITYQFGMLGLLASLVLAFGASIWVLKTRTPGTGTGVRVHLDRSGVTFETVSGLPAPPRLRAPATRPTAPRSPGASSLTSAPSTAGSASSAATTPP